MKFSALDQKCWSLRENKDPSMLQTWSLFYRQEIFLVKWEKTSQTYVVDCSKYYIYD